MIPSKQPHESQSLARPLADLRAVFLDRDGTLNEERGYLRQVEDLVLMPGVAQAVKRLNDVGILAILTTNQTGPARGFYDELHVQALHLRLLGLLAAEADAHLDAIYYCPHLYKADLEQNKQLVAQYAIDCACRKPKTGMLEQACQDFPGLDLSRSFVVGDKASDIDLARQAGCQGVLVKTGYGQRVLEGKYQQLSQQPDYVADDLTAAVDWILGRAV